MGKKSVFIVLACLLALSVVLASCTAKSTTTGTTSATTTTQTTTTKTTTQTTTTNITTTTTQASNMVNITLKKLDGTTVVKQMEKPQYGGTFTYPDFRDMKTFDLALAVSSTHVPDFQLVFDNLVARNWAMGPAGTGEIGLHYTNLTSGGFSVYAGSIAESWEMPDLQTLVFHIRHGVHFALNTASDASKLANGREIDANDVAYSLIRWWQNPVGVIGRTEPFNNTFDSITATDKWTVTAKLKPNKMGIEYYYIFGLSYIFPKEVIDKYGDMTQWQNCVGTGPFMITDYLNSSSTTLKRNPNYWQHDPFFPENQLPYVDTIKRVVIPDLSTRIAALRTGKVDWEGGDTPPWTIGREDAVKLLNDNPQLKYEKQLNSLPGGATGRIDMAPFDDIRVRKALIMAIDYQTIISKYLNGQAELLTYPTAPIRENMAWYTPLNEQSAAVQEMFSYNPTKAKQLLAEAGYPKGFDTSIIIKQTDVDNLTIFKGYWAVIGVNLNFQVLDETSFATQRLNKVYKQMIAEVPGQSEYFDRCQQFTPGHANNIAMVNDPVINKAIADSAANAFNKDIKDAIVKANAKYVLEQAYSVPFPGTYIYSIWWPWVKGYEGGITQSSTATIVSFPRYIWLDQQMKKKMGY